MISPTDCAKKNNPTGSIAMKMLFNFDLFEKK